MDLPPDIKKALLIGLGGLGLVMMIGVAPRLKQFAASLDDLEFGADDCLRKGCRSGPCFRYDISPYKTYCTKPCIEDTECPGVFYCDVDADAPFCRRPRDLSFGAMCERDQDCARGECMMMPMHSAVFNPKERCSTTCENATDCPRGGECVDNVCMPMDQLMDEYRDCLVLKMNDRDILDPRCN